MGINEKVKNDYTTSHKGVSTEEKYVYEKCKYFNWTLKWTKEGNIIHNADPGLIV